MTIDFGVSSGPEQGVDQRPGKHPGDGHPPTEPLQLQAGSRGHRHRARQVTPLSQCRPLPEGGGGGGRGAWGGQRGGERDGGRETKEKDRRWGGGWRGQFCGGRGGRGVVCIWFVCVCVCVGGGVACL